jgi:flagellin-like protein
VKKEAINMKNNKGLSGIVTTLIIILLVLVAVGVIWQVVGGLLSSSTSKIASSSICLDLGLSVKKVNQTSTGVYDITLARTGTGIDEDVYAKIVLFNDAGDASDVLDFDTALGTLATKMKPFDTTSGTAQVDDASRMEYTPYFIDEETGKEILCQTSEFEFKVTTF